ncbi:hypothetical protein ACHAWF_001961 [Thalassiosira exigua]
MKIPSSILVAAMVRSAEPTPNTGSCTIDEMYQVIDRNFKDIPAGSRVYSGAPPTDAFQYCLQDIDYNSADEDVFEQQKDQLFPTCSGSNVTNPTCTAIQATYDTFTTLEEMGCAPLFRNYLPAWKDWNQNEVACESGSFDVATKSFVDRGENGCNGFAICNILITVLMLSANQMMTGTCGTTAMFTVLSQAGPVRALRLATEIVWLGTTSYLLAEPCPYIYDMMPGVQSLPNPNSTLEEVCGESPNGDCKVYYYGYINGSHADSPPAFPQRPGINFMFTQAFATAYFRHSTGGEHALYNFLKAGDYSFTNLWM